MHLEDIGFVELSKNIHRMLLFDFHFFYYRAKKILRLKYIWKKKNNIHIDLDVTIDFN